MANVSGDQLTEETPASTYLPDHDRVWIGSKWDIAQDSYGRFHIYRKGHWVLVVGTWDLALMIVVDDEGTG